MVGEHAGQSRFVEPAASQDDLSQPFSAVHALGECRPQEQPALFEKSREETPWRKPPAPHGRAGRKVRNEIIFPRQPRKARGGAKTKDADTVALEKRISDALGLAVNIDHREPVVTVHIRYRDLDQLDEITRRLNVKN